jgi:hypothetical protein
MASGGGGQTSSVTNQPPAWLQNAAQGYLGRAGEVAGQDYQPYTQQRVADLSPVTRGSIGGLWDLANGHPMGNDAVDMTRRTLQGGFSNPFGGQGGENVGTQRNQYGGADNPHLRTIAEQGRGDIARTFHDATNRTMSRFRDPSDRNSSSFQQAQGRNEENLARGLTQYDAQLGNAQMDRALGAEESFLGRDFAGQQFNSNLGERGADRGFQGHENERNRQMQGVGATTSLLGSHRDSLNSALQAGDIERGHNQNLLDSQYGDFREWRDYDRNQLDVYGNALSRAGGGAGSTQTSQGPGPDRVSQGMGAFALANFLGRPGGGK